MDLRRIEQILQDNVDDSPYTYAARAVGFEIRPIRVIEDASGYGPHAVLPFSCVCGRHEQFHYVISNNNPWEIVEYLDLMAALYHNGSFSAQHLLNDGYPKEWVEKKTKVFDKIVRALTTPDIHRNRSLL